MSNHDTGDLDDQLKYLRDGHKPGFAKLSNEEARGIDTD
ncbi:hypothetical protein BJY26_000383 [Spelaeicoccus albus]|uniref:Uncharacterized protein n=1 Tax=Spelaeicoccus albus TaxID=1280376 RepID=A0A7Z0A818_9MICO|nr:hypothetical protein [Spelaeicoccus albus]